MRVGDRDILIPTSMVGNYPNPRWWDAGPVRDWTGIQEPPDAFNYEAFYDAMTAMVQDQEAAGLDIITDGRLQGDSYAEVAVYYYFKRLGLRMDGPYLAFPIYSRLHAVTAEAEIKRRGGMMVEQARALRSLTTRPVKVQYTGVQVLAQCVDDHFYPSARDRAMAIAQAINDDLREVDKMGVEFIQLDEFTWPYFYEDWAIEAFNKCVEGINAQIICHICWGNWGGTPAYLADEGGPGAGEVHDITARGKQEPSATASVIPKSYEANIDVLNLESCGRRSDDLSGLDVIKNNPLPENMMFWAGVIDVKSTISETAEQVASRINTLLEYIPAEKLGVTTDCGLPMIQRHISQVKLHALVAGTQMVRDQLGS